MLANQLRENWRRGKPAFGFWSVIPSAFVSELIAQRGLHYLCADQQHGLLDYKDAVQIFAACHANGVAPITRVPENRPWMIGRALDAGAQGVVVPSVNTGEEAAAAVAACRYPPLGSRSFGPTRASLVYPESPLDQANAVLCFAMVESREALNNLDGIAATPGLDGIYIGPADLALALGFSPDLDKTEPEHVEAVDTILRSCQRHDIVAGIQCHNADSGLKYAKLGFKFITIGKDSSMLQSAARAQIAAIDNAFQGKRED